MLSFQRLNYLYNLMSVGRPKKRKFAVEVTINDESLEPTPELLNVIRCENWQSVPSVLTTPMRAAKANAMAELSEVIKSQKCVKMKMKSKDTRG